MQIIKSIQDELQVFQRISFKEETHQYMIDGQLTDGPSVTQLINRYKKPFDKDAVSKKISKKLGIAQQELLDDWKEKNLYSTTIGTMLHLYAESTFLNKDVEYQGQNLDSLQEETKIKIKKNLPKLIEQFNAFYIDHKHLKCVESELILGDINGTRVCGTADLLVYNEQTQRCEILDFKTNKKIEKYNSHSNLLKPFSDYSQSELSIYTIQLNVYKYIIEAYTSLKIDKLKLIWFQHTNPTYQIFELVNIQPKIRELFSNC